VGEEHTRCGDVLISLLIVSWELGFEMNLKNSEYHGRIAVFIVM
jgi:hypothetical protein